MRKHARIVLPLFFATLMYSVLAADTDSWTGTLAPKGADAKEGIVAVLKVTSDNATKNVNLWATGETATQLTDWAAKGAKVTITGTKVDESNVKVSKVEQSK